MCIVYYMPRACKREPFDETTPKKAHQKKRKKKTVLLLLLLLLLLLQEQVLQQWGEGEGRWRRGWGGVVGGGRAWQSARERSAPARAMAVESGLDAKWCAPRRARGARCRRRRPTPLPRFPPSPPFHTHTSAPRPGSAR